MSYRIGGEFALAIVLVASLALKVANSAAIPIKDPNWVTHRMAEFLLTREFKITHNPNDVDLISLSAVNGQCQILIATVSALGWHRDVMRKIRPEGSRLMYIFKGEVYDDQPLLQTWLNHYAARLRQSIGLTPVMSPTVAVVQSSECAIAQPIAWRELNLGN